MVVSSLRLHLPNYYLFRVNYYFFRVMKKGKKTLDDERQTADGEREKVEKTIADGQKKSLKTTSMSTEKPAAKRSGFSKREITQRKETKKKVTLVRKANELVEARYRFSIWEIRVFTKLLSLIKPDDKEFFEHKINILDIIREFDLQGNKANYKWIKEGARGLMSKIIDMVITADDGKPEELMIPLLTKFKGRNDPVDGSYIKLSFSPEMKPFLLELKQRYLQYEFSNVANLRSAYYVRIYELLKQYEKIGQRKIELSEFRAMLGIRDEYQLYGIFKRKIIEAARENIEQFTDIRFTYEEIKSGKSVSAILFHIFQNPGGGKSKAKVVVESAARSVPKPVFSPIEEAEIVETGRPFSEFADKLYEWWGVNRDEFYRRAAAEKSNLDIERAIQFTKERVRSGKAENPAGVFLDALTRGLLTAEQIKAQKLAEQKQRAAEREAKIAALSQKHNDLLDQYSMTINDEVRVIVAQVPEVTETAIEAIKTTQRLLGDRQIDSNSLEDFRKNPRLRGMVITEIMRRFPERFEPISSKFAPEIESVKGQILSLEPAFSFG